MWLLDLNGPGNGSRKETSGYQKKIINNRRIDNTGLGSRLGIIITNHSSQLSTSGMGQSFWPQCYSGQAKPAWSEVGLGRSCKKKIKSKLKGGKCCHLVRKAFNLCFHQYSKKLNVQYFLINVYTYEKLKKTYYINIMLYFVL